MRAQFGVLEGEMRRCEVLIISMKFEFVIESAVYMMLRGVTHKGLVRRNAT